MLVLDVETWMADLNAQASWYLELPNVTDAVAPVRQNIMLEVIPMGDALNARLNAAGRDARVVYQGFRVACFRGGGDFASMVTGTPPAYFRAEMGLGTGGFPLDPPPSVGQSFQGATVLLPTAAVLATREWLA